MILAITPPPSVNELYPTVNGRRVKSRAYKTWIGASLWEIKMQRLTALAGPVSLSFMIPENSRRDLDGYLKASIDLLVTAGLIDGDRFKTVKELHLYWHKQPALVVEIQPYSGTASLPTRQELDMAIRRRQRSGSTSTSSGG